MRHAIHRLHTGQLLLLWGLTLLGLWAFNSRRLEPALGVEEVEVLATYRGVAPPTRNVDSLAELVTQRENARTAMAEEIAADSLALIDLVANMPVVDLMGSERTDDESALGDSAGRDSIDRDSTGRDSTGRGSSASTSGAKGPPRGLPLSSPERHFAYATTVVDSTWPWTRTIPSRVRQRAVNGEAERVRLELDAYREESLAWTTARVKVRRSLVVKGMTLALFFVAVGVTWMWFGRPRREEGWGDAVA